MISNRSAIVGTTTLFVIICLLVLRDTSRLDNSLSSSPDASIKIYTAQEGHPTLSGFTSAFFKDYNTRKLKGNARIYNETLGVSMRLAYIATSPLTWHTVREDLCCILARAER